MSLKKLTERMDSIFDRFADDILNLLSAEEPEAATPPVLKRMKALLYHTVHAPTVMRGHFVPMVYEKVVKNPTEEQLYLANVLGWCFQTFQAIYCLLDDIVDGAEYRFSKICWHRLQTECPLLAVNDALVLEHATYRLMRKCFGADEQLHRDLVELCQDAIYKQVLGQNLDAFGWRDNLDIPNAPQDFDYEKALKSYKISSKYKAATFTIQLPTYLALRLAGITRPDNRQLYEEVEKITIKLGLHCAYEDDCADWVGSDKTASCNDDIRNGRHTWFYLQAKRLCQDRPAEDRILNDNYGKEDTRCIQAILELYKTLGLEQEFRKWEAEVVADLKRCIKDMSEKQDMAGLGEALLFATETLMKMSRPNNLQNHW